MAGEWVRVPGKAVIIGTADPGREVLRAGREVVLAAEDLAVAEAVNNERELTDRARAGDLNAFSALVEQYQERAVHVAQSFVGNFEDAKDLAQEAFVKAYGAIADFKGESRFFTWFYRILVNTCRDFLRKKKWSGQLFGWFQKDGAGEEAQEPIEERVASREAGALLQLTREELKTTIHTALERLPFQQRSAFTLRYLEGLSTLETAASLGLTEGAVKAHLWQACQKLRKLLKEFMPEGV